MNRSKLDEFLFGIPDRPMSRAERIEIIRKRISSDAYLTDERLDAALERMLEEIQTGN
jgi:hypothetical protein